MEIWRRAVDATHHFLTPEDRRDIEAEVAVFLPGAPLDLAVDEADRAIGFMLLEGNHMEALFVDPDFHGSGVGRALVEHAVKRYPDLSTDVNEQNLQAIDFYEKLGCALWSFRERWSRKTLSSDTSPLRQARTMSWLRIAPIPRGDSGSD